MYRKGPCAYEVPSPYTRLLAVYCFDTCHTHIILGRGSRLKKDSLGEVEIADLHANCLGTRL